MRQRRDRAMALNRQSCGRIGIAGRLRQAVACRQARQQIACKAVAGSGSVHRLYLGERGTGILMLVLGVTIIGLFITGPWAFIDLFLIPSIIRKRVDETRQRLTIDAIA